MKFSIKKDAIEFRNDLGYGNTDALNLNSLLIKLGIIAVFKKLSNSHSGMAIRTNKKNFILINSDHSLGRQNFSICHELFHLYKDDNYSPHYSHAGSFARSGGSEYYADVFASYLLLPEDGVISLIPDDQLPKDRIGIDTVLKIEHFFQCSRNALLYRLKDLKIISSEKYDQLNYSITKIAKLHGYSTDLYESGNEGKVVGDYGTIAKFLFDKEKISEGHYISLMSDIGIDISNDFYNYSNENN